MKYNPISKELFTDAGAFIKKLYCPLAKQWDELSEAELLKGKMCNQCQKTVFDTALLTENELLNLVTNQPSTCLKVDLNQDNLTITYKQHEK